MDLLVASGSFPDPFRAAQLGFSMWLIAIVFTVPTLLGPQRFAQRSTYVTVLTILLVSAGVAEHALSSIAHDLTFAGHIVRGAAEALVVPAAIVGVVRLRRSRRHVEGAS